MNIRTEIITTIEEWQNLTPTWLKLLSQAQTNHFFQTPWFLQTWWETLGSGKLHLITFWNEADLVGIAPTYITQQKQLQFVGDRDLCDYLDLIVHQAHQKEVYEAFTQELIALKDQGVTSVSLVSLPGDSPTVDALKSSTEIRFESHRQDVSPRLQLPNSWEEYLASLERKQRHEIRRKWRKLESEFPHQFLLVENDSDLSRASEEFITLHQKSSPEKNLFWTPQRRLFFTKLIETMAAQGLLRLFFLEIEGKKVATMLGFVYKHSFYLYNSGFEPTEYKEIGTGSTLLAYTIKYAIENNLKVFDFLRGDEAYKFRLGGVGSPVWDLSANL